MADSEGRQPILVPVDFSPPSEAALCYAAELAPLVDAPLIVLHVVHDPESAPGYYARTGPDGELLQREQVAGSMLTEFLERMRGQHASVRGASLTTQLVVGLPVTRILEVAQKERARLIVMGSLGRTGLPHLLLGSKAERVLQLSPVPVTIVKAAAGPAAGGAQ